MLARLRAPENADELPLQNLDHEEETPAKDQHVHALELLKQGIRTSDLQLIDQAREKFEAVLTIIPDTDSNTVSRCRVTVNLAIALRWLGNYEGAIDRLNGVRHTLISDVDPLFNGPRALDALGNSHVELAQFSKAIDAYNDALTALEGIHTGNNRDRAVLRARILSNRAVAYIDSGQSGLAVRTLDEAIGLLQGAEEALSLGRTLRVQAEALQSAAALNDDPTEAHQTLSRAISVFEQARSLIRSYGSMEEWADATATLAGAESDLGDLLTKPPFEGDRNEGINHLRRGIARYVESYSRLSDDCTDDVRHFLRRTLIYLIQVSPQPSNTIRVVSQNLNYFLSFLREYCIYFDSDEIGAKPSPQLTSAHSAAAMVSLQEDLDHLLLSHGITMSQARADLLNKILLLIRESQNEITSRLLFTVPTESSNEHVDDRSSLWEKAKLAGEKLPDFIMRLYAEKITAGLLTKADFFRDKKLYHDYFEWRRKRNIPAELHWLRDLPTKREQAAQRPPEPVRIEDFTPEQRETIRAYEAAKRRAQRRRARDPRT